MTFSVILLRNIVPDIVFIYNIYIIFVEKGIA